METEVKRAHNILCTVNHSKNEHFSLFASHLKNVINLFGYLLKIYENVTFLETLVFIMFILKLF